MATETQSTAGPRVSDETRVALPVKKRVKVRDLWRSREVARVLAVRDLKVKYKQSVLGPMWLIVQPLGILAGLVVAFNGVANVKTAGTPYIPFALTGLFVWTLVQQTLLNGVNSFPQNSLLIRRVAAPRPAFMLAALLSNLLAPSVIFVGAVVAILATVGTLPVQALLLPLVAVWLLVFTFGWLCIFASWAVRFRDVQALLPFWSQAGLFLTPVGFSLATAPGKVETVLSFNPLSGLLELTRWCMLDISFSALPLIVSAVATVLVAWGGWQIFARMETSFADVI